VPADSSAALCMGGWIGAGKTRALDAIMVWAQHEQATAKWDIIMYWAHINL